MRSLVGILMKDVVTVELCRESRGRRQSWLVVISIRAVESVL